VIRPRDIRTFVGPLVLLFVSTVLATASCSTSGPGSSSSSRVPVTTVPVTTPLAGFRTMTLTIVGADGRSRSICVLVADTEALREQGLMFVEDRSLDGHEGMLFVFSEDDTSSFWMRHTRLPLSIAYLRADGSVVSTTDMAPCPDDEAHCPTYPSGGAYRYAIEVPQGELEQLGIDAGARLTLGAQGCNRSAPATAA
jgi:uncharacterized membrane protein (UPF0127 family)